jgi:hypothetical protein
MEKKRELLEVDYATYTGQKFNKYDVYRYNYVQGRINAAIDAGIPVLESQLFDSFNIFQSVALRGIEQ